VTELPSSWNFTVTGPIGIDLFTSPCRIGSPNPVAFESEFASLNSNISGPSSQLHPLALNSPGSFSLTGDVTYLFFFGGGVYITDEIEGTLYATPLPAALPLFGTAPAGLGGAGWFTRRGKVS